MKNLQIIYNKNRQQEPIKCNQPATFMQIDHNNNIYISIGSEIRVISLRRLSKQKDFIIDIIKMQKIFGRENGVDKVDKSFQKNEKNVSINKKQDKKSSEKVKQSISLEEDILTMKFNDPLMQLIELKQYLIDDEGNNQLLQPSKLKNRIRYLNDESLLIKCFVVSPQRIKTPDISILLSTGHLFTLKNVNDQYQLISKKIVKNVRVIKYLNQNILIVGGQQLMIKNVQTEQVINQKNCSFSINLIQFIDLKDRSKLILVGLQEIQIRILKNYKVVGIYSLKLNETASNIHINPFGQPIIYLSTISNYYSLKITQQKPTLQKCGSLQNEKMLLHDGVNCFTSLNYKQNTVTKFLEQSQNGLYISFGHDIGRTFKQIDLIIGVSNQYQLLKHCVYRLWQCHKHQNYSANFHDLRMLQGKQIFLDFEKVIVALNFQGNKKSRDKQILDKALQSIQFLNIPQKSLQNITQKILLYLSLITTQVKKSNSRIIMLQIIKKRFKQIVVDESIFWKRCMFSYSKLKGALLECIQCKMLGNKQNAGKQTRCCVCWGQLKLIQVV